jgi:hypothetical protein
MSNEQNVMIGWRDFPVGEKIGDAPGNTKTVQFRNQTEAKGKYALKVGNAASERDELKAGEKSEKYEVRRQAWNAENIGAFPLRYERDNSADVAVT